MTESKSIKMILVSLLNKMNLQLLFGSSAAGKTTTALRCISGLGKT